MRFDRCGENPFFTPINAMQATLASPALTAPHAMLKIAATNAELAFDSNRAPPARQPRPCDCRGFRLLERRTTLKKSAEISRARPRCPLRCPPRLPDGAIRGLATVRPCCPTCLSRGGTTYSPPEGWRTDPSPTRSGPEGSSRNEFRPGSFQPSTIPFRQRRRVP